MPKKIGAHGTMGLAIALMVGCAANVNAPGGGGGGSNGIQPPVINALTTNPSSVTVTNGQPLTMQVAASDPNGEALSFNWSATGGTLNSTTGQLIYWVPPSTPGLYSVSVVVTDAHGASTSGSVNVTVNGQGQAVVAPSAPTAPPVPTPAVRPVSAYTVNAQTNVFTWQWQRETIDVRGWGPTQVTLQSINAPYNSVVIEYESVLSRQIAIVSVDHPVVLDLRGSAWAYCVGSAPVSGTLTLSNGSRSQIVTIDQVAPVSGGQAVSTPPHSQLICRGGEAFNDAATRTPFYQLLAVTLGPDAVRYKVLRPGDRVPASQNGSTTYVGFTDTSDGVSDNAGNWQIEAEPER